MFPSSNSNPRTFVTEFPALYVGANAVGEDSINVYCAITELPAPLSLKLLVRPPPREYTSRNNSVSHVIETSCFDFLECRVIWKDGSKDAIVMQKQPTALTDKRCKFYCTI